MYKTIDLFAGAGGLSYGFEQTGEFQVVAAVELNKDAQKTYKANHIEKQQIKMIDDVRKCDFEELNRELGGIDVVIGGPPCQGFSNANRQKNHIISMNNSLVKEYFRAIKEIKPKAFIMENVSMLSSETHRFYDSFIDHNEIESLGLEMKEEELVISEIQYKNYPLLSIIKTNEESSWKVSSDLFQLLNVLYKDRKSKTGRLSTYIQRNAKEIIDAIADVEAGKFEILDNLASALSYEDKEIEKELIEGVFDKEELKQRKEEYKKYISEKRKEQVTPLMDELGCFLQFQKSFKLIEELNDNKIIYQLEYRENTSTLIAKVKSYAVIDYVSKIIKDLYVTDKGVINSIWFGVPQYRRRFIVMGVREDIIRNKEIEVQLPAGEKNKIVTVGEAILDLKGYKTKDDPKFDSTQEYADEEPSEYAKKMREGAEGVNNHIIPKTKEDAQKRFNALMEGQNFHDLDETLKNTYSDPERTQNSIYLRLEKDKPSGTVTNVRKSMWIHPELPRAISVREAARLQSFPDKFIFEGKKDSQYQQVGNAVPPLMARGIAEQLLKYI